MRVTMLCVRVRVEPSAPYVTETNRGCNGVRRCTDSHSVCSICSSFGGKNSNETVGRPRRRVPALPMRSLSWSTDILGSSGGNCRLRRPPRQGDQQMCIFGVDWMHALAFQTCAGEPLAQRGDRVG